MTKKSTKKAIILKAKYRLTFIEPLLGTASGDEEIYQNFIAAKTEKDTSDEIAAIPADEQIVKGTTVFTRNEEGQPVIWDYQVKGFFKDACGILRRVPGSDESELKAYKKVIDGLVFVGPRQIPLILPEGGELDFCERPLRASTAQGERIALARSEQAPAGTIIDIEVKVLDDDLIDMVESWFDYGADRGLGQWRNSGKGRFTWETTK